ncbi:hypothetical protein E8D34_10030 [Nocardioides sp. GY 10113]|uniref:hypothetical protein n=1 Tax=Nocardioides sp. GY 10113 TaxID=2569761 RepID=UPI0010A93FC3|nr:hypothetical protein [Nocardioides sp. GY 10113]TIC87454.1 hypothetical protein E8D34_10030 [Nocardioides sp. GY 10113]
MKRIALTLTAVACLAAPAASAAPSGSPGTAAGGVPAVAGRAAPPPSAFAHPGRNPWFPLRPGTRWVLRGVDEGHRLVERVVVTRRHRVVAGIRARVVRDVVRRADGSIAERTRDWYAVDDRGTVWYLGEATATYDRHGDLEDRDGSWEAGVDGAVAGRIMPAHPRVDTAYRQEYWKGEAEDQAWVVQRGTRVATPAASGRGIRTLEWTRLEPRVVSQKLYLRGYGQVAERDLSGGSERFELVRFSPPGT